MMCSVNEMAVGANRVQDEEFIPPRNYISGPRSYPIMPYGNLASPMYGGFGFPPDNAQPYQQAQYNSFNTGNGQGHYTVPLMNGGGPYLEVLQDYNMSFQSTQKLFQGQIPGDESSGYGQRAISESS